jgi:hypothetical protein
VNGAVYGLIAAVVQVAVISVVMFIWSMWVPDLPQTTHMIALTILAGSFITHPLIGLIVGLKRGW